MAGARKSISFSAFETIILGTLIAGVIDIAASIGSYMLQGGKGPVIVFRYIASGLFGRAAFSGDIIYVFAGVLIHFGISFICTTTLFLIFPFIKKWLRFNLIIAFLAGAAIWAVMNFGIIPRSKVPPTNPGTIFLVYSLLIVIFCFGIPATLLVARYYKSKMRSES